MISVLLTGSNGRIGPFLVAPFLERYKLRTFDLSLNESVRDAHEGNIADFDAVRAAMRDVEVVVHLAATSDEAPFVEDLVPHNVIGTYNVLEAARLEGVRRVVFASSCQAIGRGLDEVEPADTSHFRPVTLYGATKVMGEAMGRFYSDKHGLEFVGVRIGYFEPPGTPRHADALRSDIYLSAPDLENLFIRAIETPGIDFVVVTGTSKTSRERMSLRTAREILGYEPVSRPSEA